ncbi:MAG: hypothetical protein ACRCW2_01430 [Cellulosilyticaceae bacterium]
MNESYYSKVEGILYGFPKLKVEIDNLKLDLEEVNEIVGIRGASPNEKAGSTTYAFSSAVENEVIERDEKLEEKLQAITRAIVGKERQAKKIENILATLTEEESMLIEMKYFKRYTVSRICEILDISSDTFTKRRKKIIVKRLMPLFNLR